MYLFGLSIQHLYGPKYFFIIFHYIYIIFTKRKKTGRFYNLIQLLNNKLRTSEVLVNHI